MDLAHLLLDLLPAAEFDHGTAAGFRGRHAASDVGASQLFDMEGDLAVHISPGGAPGSIARFRSPEDSVQPAHRRLLLSLLKDESDGVGEPVPCLFLGGKLLAAF